MTQSILHDDEQPSASLTRASRSTSPTPMENGATGTKFLLDALSAHGFTMVLSTQYGPASVALGPSQEVSGFVTVRDGVTHIHASTDTQLTLAKVSYPLRESTLDIEGPVQFEPIAMNMRVGGTGLDGTTQAKAASAQRLQIHANTQRLDLEDFRLDSLDVKACKGATEVRVATTTVASLLVPTSRGAVQLLDVTATGFRVALTPTGMWTVTIDLLEAKTVHAPLDGVDLGIEGLRLEGIEWAGTGVASIRRVAGGRLRGRASDINELMPQRTTPKAQRKPLDLSLVNLMTGFVSADVVTDVRIPIIQHRRALHPVRLDVVDGKVQWERLESCLANLEDAVLDLAIEEDRLCLIKDIPLIPFDRATLVSWELPGEELATARGGWVTIARLARPTVEIETKPKGVDEGPRFLEEISASSIAVGVRVAAHEEWPLSSGGTIQLGDASADVPAIESLKLSGNMIYRPDERNDPGTLELESSTIRLGLNRVRVGNMSLEGAVVVDHAKARLRLADLTPESLEATLEGVQLTEVRLAPLATPTSAGRT